MNRNLLLLIQPITDVLKNMPWPLFQWDIGRIGAIRLRRLPPRAAS